MNDPHSEMQAKNTQGGIPHDRAAILAKVYVDKNTTLYPSLRTCNAIGPNNARCANQWKFYF